MATPTPEDCLAFIDLARAKLVEAIHPATGATAEQMLEALIPAEECLQAATLELERYMKTIEWKVFGIRGEKPLADPKD